MDLTEYLKAATPRVDPMVIAFEDDTFTLYLKHLDRTQLDQLWRQATRKVFDEKTRQYRDEPNNEKLRKLVVEQAVTDWQGLTYGMAARIARKVPPNGNLGTFAPAADDPVPFSPASALALVETIVNLENEIWKELMKSVERREAEEAAEKKT